MRRSTRSILLCLLLPLLAIGWNEKTPADHGPFFKIYLSGNTLCVSEYQYGIRLYDVADVGAPALKNFLALDGNADMAVKGNILYCDSYKDLVVYDISDRSNPVRKTEIKDVFNKVTNFVDRMQTSSSTTGGTSGCVSTGCSEDNRSIPVYAYGTGNSGSGSGGSLARFCINETYLYCVDNTDLVVFDIVHPEAPVYVARVGIGWGIETIFPYKNYLFIGSRTHMYIFNANDVRRPVLVSEFQHSRACDPVVVEDTLAYITLKNGGACGPSPNVMHVVSVADLLNPRLLGSTADGLLDGPNGLAVRNRIVYICDGASGLKTIDATYPTGTVLVGRNPGPDLFDIIPDGNRLFAVGPYGVFIYDITDPHTPKQVGRIDNTAM